MADIHITRADPASPVAAVLFSEIAAEMAARYGGNGVWGFTPADLKGERSVFVVAYTGDQPVGCGGLMAVSPTQAEIKRVYVRPAARGQGLSRQIMAALEADAQTLGYTHIRLETGLKQPAAIHIYESLGYQRVPCWGDYSQDPMSVCYSKSL